jgi:hypothetical protein
MTERYLCGNLDEADANDARDELAKLPLLPADASELARCERAVLVTNLLGRAGVKMENPDGDG